MLRLAVVLVLGVLAQQTFADEPEAIVGGTAAAVGEFPWQISLRLNGYHNCGGSIVTTTKILTAAHCVLGTNYKNLQVVTGNINNRAGIVHQVKGYLIHRQYMHGGENSWRNDIAVITLYNPIQYDKFQRPIALADSPPQVGAQCTLSGWGKTAANGRIPQYLLKMPTSLISKDECQRNARPHTISATHLCAFTKPGVGACQGDSGGPLVCGGRQYGITSWVFPCAKGRPDVYTNVYHHLDFIHQATKN